MVITKPEVWVTNVQYAFMVAFRPFCFLLFISIGIYVI